VTVSFEQIAPEDETATLRQRVERLRSSLEWAREAIPAPIRAELHATVDRCEERLRLGIDWTVVALAGGTGSGKSSLFNAITGVDFAVPGVARPTTAHVSAAVWGGDDPGPLLEWIGVSPAHRLRRTESPEAGEEPELKGLILLDLPDHDSINPHNHETVDRMLPRVDLLLWVVDPQKYADHAIHDLYLRAAAEQGQPSLVALNQVDRLSTEDGWAVARDLQKLLAVDGLVDVPVMPVSARTGQGVDVLRAELEGAVQARSVAADAVAADLVDAGRTLERALARDADPVLPDIAELVAALCVAAGVEARAEAAGAVVAGRGGSVPDVAPIGREVVERERLDWIDASSEGLPVTWRVVIADAVAPADELTDAVRSALDGVEWPEASRSNAMFRRRAHGAAFRRDMVALGREAVLAAVEPLLATPTARIHEAYRNLDELTVIARAEAPETARRAREEHERAAAGDDAVVESAPAAGAAGEGDADHPSDIWEAEGFPPEDNPHLR